LKDVILVNACDAHVPHHDPTCISLLCEFLKDVKPHIVVLHEICDWYQLSKFDKDPIRRLQLQSDLDQSKDVLSDIRRACPRAAIKLLESNHDDRLQKFIRAHAAEFSSLRSLHIDDMLGLSKLRIDYQPDYTYNGVLFQHGSIVRKHSAVSAKAEFEKQGMSGCTGHTHRLGVYYKRTRAGIYSWVESGCMCRLDPEYIKGVPDWQQGWVVYRFINNGEYYHHDLVEVIKGQVSWGNDVYTTRRSK
jgi:hypothetical protein